jgi:hypothetical protein
MAGQVRSDHQMRRGEGVDDVSPCAPRPPQPVDEEQRLAGSGDCVGDFPTCDDDPCLCLGEVCLRWRPDVIRMLW